MAKWNPLALKLLMWVMGALLAAGSASNFIGNSFFGFDTWWGVTATVAGVAFGAGVMIAGFEPTKNVAWVRALVLYAILEIVYQIFNQVAVARFDIVAFIIAILVAVLAVFLYPNKLDLVPSGMGMKAKA